MLKNKIFAAIIIILTIFTAIFMNIDKYIANRHIIFSDTMSIKQLALANNLPVKEIQHVVSHEDISVWDANKNLPIKNIGIDITLFEEAIHHVKAETRPLKDMTKFILWSLWLSFIVLYVLPNKYWRVKRPYLLFTVLLVFGVFLGSTPNAMESVVKFFKFTNGMEGEFKIVTLSLVLFSLFSIWGSKLFCSWGCQLGALQETIFNIPLVKNKYKLKIPFGISLFIRLILFSFFICLLYGWIFGVRNFVIFHNINLFKIFDLALPKIAIFVLPAVLILFFLTYRPFCHFICPFSIYSWLLENLAINRIKVDKNKCINCNNCVKACPTDAMKTILEGRKKYFLPDCWSCEKCIDACPVKAIEYK